MALNVNIICSLLSHLVVFKSTSAARPNFKRNASHNVIYVIPQINVVKRGNLEISLLSVIRYKTEKYGFNYENMDKASILMTVAGTVI